MKKILAVCLFFTCKLCFSNFNHKTSVFYGDGVITSITKEGSFTFDDDITIYNDDFTKYAEIIRNKKGNIVVAGIKNISIRAFYPDYDIIIFDAIKKDNTIYKVYINGLWKLIKINNKLKFYNLENFVLHTYIELIKESPLRKEAKNTSPIILNSEKYSYEVIEVKKDWVKLKCLYNCEGCPENGKIITGWVKWRDRKKILVKLFYIC